MHQRIRPRESRNITRHRTDNDPTSSANKRWTLSLFSLPTRFPLIPPTLRTSSGTNEPYATQLRQPLPRESLRELLLHLPFPSGDSFHGAWGLVNMTGSRLTDVVIDIVLSSYLNTPPCINRPIHHRRRPRDSSGSVKTAFYDESCALTSRKQSLVN